MRHSLLLPALVATAISGMTPALAADEDLPPEFRSSTFEIYGGVFGAADTLRSKLRNDTGAVFGELDGTGFGYGLRSGVDYVMDGWLVGAVGDWSFGRELASDSEIDADVTLKHLGTFRGRAGVNLGNSLVYLTGGVARLEGKFSIEDISPLVGTREEWITSLTIGGGVDVGLTDSLTLGVEYLYIDGKDLNYTFGTGPTAEDVTYEFKGLHTIRVGMNYAFSI